MRQHSSTMRKNERLALVFMAVLFAICESASATGFFINQQSVKGRGRVDAGNSTAADDLGTIFFNPAGLIQLRRSAQFDNADEPGDWRFSIGTQLIVPRSRQTNTGSTAATPGTLGTFAPYAGTDFTNPTNPSPIPNLYAAKWFADGKGALAFALNVPFGLKTEFDPAWYGRYDATEASLRTFNLSLVGAYEVSPRLSIGGGLDVQYARATLSSAIPKPENPGGPTVATDGQISTVGHAWTPGFNVGLIYNLDDKAQTRIGVHYRSGMTHHISGTTTIANLTGFTAGLNGTFGIHSDLKLPGIATAGIWHNVTPDLAVLGEIEWYNWSKFNEIRIRFDNGLPDAVRAANYRDTFAVAVGAEYQARKDLKVRGGVKFDRTPTTDSFRDTTVPDADRLWLGLGASYRFSKMTNLDFAFNHVFFRDTNVAVTRTFFDGTALATSVRVNGAVKNTVNTIALELRFAY